MATTLDIFSIMISDYIHAMAVAKPAEQPNILHSMFNKNIERALCM